MKVLLLGPNGQLGRDIICAHEEVGKSFELIPLGREKLDVAAPGMVECVLNSLNFDALVNCIGNKMEEVEDNAALAFAVNAHAVQAMARACAAKRARFVHVSTDYVFGGDAACTRPLREDDPTAPVNVYGASKAMGETLARLASDSVTVLRVASLFGVAGVRGEGGNFVETMIRVGKEKGALRVVDDQTMSPTATADVARVILQVLTGGCTPGLYHVVNSGSTTWFDFAREIVRCARVEATVTPCSSKDYPARGERPRYSALDNARISTTFGAMQPWQDALERYLRARGHVK